MKNDEKIGKKNKIKIKWKMPNREKLENFETDLLFFPFLFYIRNVRYGIRK